MAETPTFESTLEAVIRRVVKEELAALKADLNGQDDRLLNADQASRLLGMSRHWLYRHATKLPFTRRLGPKNLRFSYQGIQKYVVTRKIS